MPITRDVNSTVKRRRLAAAVLALALIPAGTADAATKHRKPKAKKAVATKVATAKVALAPAPAPVVAAPAPATPAAPAVNSVISIGGYVFYNLTYAQAVEAYAAAVAAAPPGYVPPAVTSISVNTTVGSS